MQIHRLLISLLFAAVWTAFFVPGAAIAASLEDGPYMAEVILTGGSGRAQVESPTAIMVADREITAAIVWSSPYYEYMTVDGDRYYPVNTSGNAAFEIPVSLDEDLPVSAQTIAMSVPHEIEYTLYFDSNTVKPFSENGDDSSLWGIVFTGAGLVIVLVVFIIARRKGRGHPAQ